MSSFEALWNLPTGMLVALGAVIVLQLALDAIALVDLYKRPAEALVFANKWIWLAIIVLVSMIGSIAYLILARKAPPTAESRPGPSAASDAAARARDAADLLYGARKDGEKR